MIKGQETFLSEVTVPANLLEAILVRIGIARRRTARIRFSLLMFGIISSGIALVPAVTYAVSEFQTSGFYEYLSLLFSDSTIAFAYWREIGYSLVESTPSLAVLLLVFLGASFIWSLRNASRNMKVAFGRLQTA